MGVNLFQRIKGSRFGRLLFWCACISVVTVNIIAVNFGLLKPASAATTTGWVVEQSSPINDQSLQQVVCVSSTNCISYGAVSSQGSSFGLYNSSNAGSTWTQNPTPPNANSSNPIYAQSNLSCPSASVCYFNGPNDGVFESTDSGSTWTMVSGTSLSSYYTDSLACVSTTDCIVAGTNNSTNTPAILVSTNSGSTWTADTLPSSLTSSYSFSGAPLSCNLGGICMAFATDNSVFPQTTKVLLSTNNGSSWSDITSDFGSSQVTGIYCSNASTTQCLVSSFGSVYITTNSGTSFTQETSGLPSGMQLGASFCPSSTQCYVATSFSDQIYESINQGSSWSALTLPSQLTSSSFIDSIYCSSTSDCVAVGSNVSSSQGFSIVSTNGGSSFSYGLVTPTGSNTVSDISCVQTSSVCYGAAGSYFVYSNNGGSSWSNLTLPSGIVNSSSISCPNTTTCYATAMNTSTTPPASGVIYSTNSGSTWTFQSLPLGSYSNITIFFISCESTSSCVATGVGGTSGGSSQQVVFYTTNSGTTWTQGTPPAADLSGYNLSLDCAAGTSNCYATGQYFDSGTGSYVDYVQTSTNSGSTWTDVSPSVSNAIFTNISCPTSSDCYVLNPRGDDVLFTSNGGSSWSTLTVGASGLNLISCYDSTDCTVIGTNSSGDVTSYTTANSGTNWYYSVVPQVQGMNLTAPANSISCYSSVNCQLSGSTITEVGILGLNLGAPSAPINPVASSQNTTATISWSAPTNDGGANIISYTVTGTDTTTNSTLTPVTVSGSPPATTASFSSLTAGDTYVFTVTASNAFGTSSASSSNSITITILVPSISSISPSSGPPSGGTSVTIMGSNFTSNATVTFGGNVGSDTFVSSTELMATSPPGAGSVSVVVTENGQTSNSVTFSYLAPTISSISPSSGPPSGGTVVTITGSNFTSNATVTFGGNPATAVTFVSSTEIQATSPQGSGSVSVVVTESGQTSNSLSFNYLAPTISSISPSSGTTSGGTVVTITGSNFTSNATVTFGGNPATAVTFVSSTEIQATSPSGTGSVAVVVVQGPQVSNSLSFTYTSSSSQTVYNPVTPTRICDTRPVGGSVLANQCNSGTGSTNSNGPLGVGQVLSINVEGTFNGITVPSNATAVVLNVTVTGTTQPGGFLTVWPTGSNQPNTSVINFGANDTIANLVQVQIGSGGQVSIYNFNGSTNVIVDLEGYYAPSSSTAGLFVPISPVRVCDTRPPSGSTVSNQCDTGSNKTMGAGTTLTVNVSGSGPGGSLDLIPSNAIAVVLNVTATNTTQAGGFLTVYPTPSTSTTPPGASNLNFGAGISIANRVIVPIGANGDISIYNFNGSTDVIVDVNGYFTGSGATSGDVFNPIVPTRICDTRTASTGIASNQCDNGTTSNNGPLTAGETISVQASNISTIPSNATAVVLNVTATNTTSNGGFFTIYPTPASSGSTPSNSDLNWSAGETIANQVVVKIGANDSVNVYNAIGSTDLIIDVMGYYS